MSSQELRLTLRLWISLNSSCSGSAGAWLMMPSPSKDLRICKVGGVQIWSENRLSHISEGADMPGLNISSLNTLQCHEQNGNQRLQNSYLQKPLSDGYLRQRVCSCIPTWWNQTLGNHQKAVCGLHQATPTLPSLHGREEECLSVEGGCFTERLLS